MVLYEDLRIYTIWRSEVAQSRHQSIDYKKTATEWEILGELAERLHHFDEAIDAYRQCLSIRFSPKAMRGVLKLYEKQGDTRGMLNALIRLVAWQYRWYSEVSFVLRPPYTDLSLYIDADEWDSSRPSCYSRCAS